MLVDRINFLTYLNDKQNWIETPQLSIHTKLVLIFLTTWLPDVRVQTATIKTNELTSNKISDHLMQPNTRLSLSNDSIKNPMYGWFTNYKKGDCAKLQNDLQSFNGFIINSYSSRTRRIWADIYNQRGRRPSWLLSAHIRQVREE